MLNIIGGDVGMRKILSIIGVLWLMGALGSGCTSLGTLLEPPTPFGPPSKGELKGRHLTQVPLSKKWTEVKILDYSSRFTFPPPGGYRVLHYVDYIDNVTLDMYREVIDEEDNFLDIIKRRRDSDHCELYGEKFSNLNGMDLIEVNGDCYIWHRGNFKRKYYFLRVGYLVFTFRLFSGPKDFERNVKEFDKFVNFAINNYLIHPTEEEYMAYEHYAYPISREDLISFFKPALYHLKKKN